MKILSGITWFLSIIILVCACSSNAKENIDTPKGSERVTFKTDDGFTIAATLLKAEKEDGGPAVVLAHKLNSNRSEWSELQTLLKKEGITTLAIDLRGHGESTDRNGKKTDWKNFSDSDFMGMITDIKTAVKYLKEKTKVDTARVGLIGASIGSNSALRTLADKSQIKTAIALSPGLNYHSVTTEDAVKKVTKRPMYLVAAKGDEYAADSVKKLYEVNTKQVTKEIITGKKHGVPMFETKPELKTSVVNWFKDKLK